MSQAKIHIMVDIETLDVIPSAVILSIGAVTMPQDSSPPQEFYVECDKNQLGRTVSEATVNWWKQQPEEIHPKGTILLIDALNRLTFFILHQRAEPIIWCKGTDFDVAILANVFAQFQCSTPWKYNAIRDMRTLKKVSCHTFCEVNPQFHNALADAKHQAAELRAIFIQNPGLVMA